MLKYPLPEDVMEVTTSSDSDTLNKPEFNPMLIILISVELPEKLKNVNTILKTLFSKTKDKELFNLTPLMTCTLL